jgi:hypothetical protein
MKKTLIAVVIVILVLMLSVAAVFLFEKNNPTATTGVVGTGTTPSLVGGNTTTSGSNSSGAPLLLGDATIPSSDISSAMPSDAPHGPTMTFQTASGTVVLKNFYNVAQGYFFTLNTLLLASSPSYTIWYYRDNSEFSMVIPLEGTESDENAAATVLAADLGVSEQELCNLPVVVIFMIDRGMDSEQYPLDFCPVSAFTSSQ